MDYAVQFQKLCQVETRRLLFVMGIIFAVVLVLQSSALPYRNVISSLVPAAKVLVPGKRSSQTASSPKSVRVGNVTLLNGSNSTNSYVALVLGNNTNASHMGKETKHENKTKGKDTDHGFAQEGIDPNDAFKLDKDRKPQNGAVFEKVVAQGKTSPLDNVESPDDGSIIEKVIEPEHDPLEQVRKSDDDLSLHNDQKKTIGLTLEKVGSADGFASPLLVSPTSNDITLLRKLDANSSTSDILVTVNISSMGKQATETQSKDKSPEQLQVGWVTLNNNSSSTSNPIMGEKRRVSPTSISTMNILLLQSRISPSSMKPRWSSVRDRELLSVKSQIKNAPIIWNDPELYALVLRNVSMFKRSYELMEHILKVYIYREGEKPIFHQPQLKGIYASEGWFMKLMEGNKRFIVKDPRKAHLFYLPFSSKMLRMTLYEHNSNNRKDLAQYLKNYVDMIAGKYRFWNRTGGLDHFLVACHDWAPRETRQIMGNCIRALCNTNVLQGFRIGMDVSLPVTYMRTVENPLRDLGGNPPSERPILAFFAGNLHGYLRSILLKNWENKDPDMKISGPMSQDVKGKMDYVHHMKSSKYCICARGYEVHTPRVVEAIFYECVPVIISDNYVPPFFEVLNWEAFSVFVLEKDIPNLKNILLSISEEKYLEMQLRVKKVQQHFLWHKKPVKYDLFHMTLHSIWYNRVFQIIPR
ncbi:hypothetical protein HHK36_021657 [Tetracentron sinense]|uniref:Exostosin GT47 domain-containing protein n=1 Tax=Tetracentron sinense TaxID=13715 RepID=A0A834YVH8_TETSI|nr:hypothetical protein HHK36_021657 [Tetracentron sinense]